MRPRSIAIVGASDRSRWSESIFGNLSHCGYRGSLHLVNARGARAHGRSTATNCAALGEPVDLGIVLVPDSAVPEVVADLGASGARAAMVLSSGFAETGPQGLALQRLAIERAAAHSMRLLGPNSLGFINFADRVWSWATPIQAPSRPHGVGLVSQSGATALFVANLAGQQDIGLSHVIATGNEADLEACDFVEFLIDDPHTRAIAMFVETVRDPARFVCLARHALAVAKPLVVLKVGASEATARSAQAHTGALVGDDRVFDGLCRQFGIVRVGSIEDLLTGADMLARTGVMRPGGLAIVSNSGGVCEIAADTAHRLGIDVPELDTRAATRIRELIPGYASPHNPLDLTGGIEPESCEQIIRAIGSQADVAAVLCPYYDMPKAPAEASDRLTRLHTHLARGLQEIDLPGFLVSYTSTVVTGTSREIVARIDAPYMACGLDRALSAVAGAMRWSERRRSLAPALVADAAASPGVGPGSRSPHPRNGDALAHATTPHGSDRPESEFQAMRHLAAHGVPVVPMQLAGNREAAVAAAGQLGMPVAVKIASADIAHKSDIGGVQLGLSTPTDVASAFDRVLAAAFEHHPQARVDGVLVSPMRARGIELLVGCARDPQWGPVITVGLGGVWVEVLRDVSLRLLPIDAQEARRMLRELRGARMLEGQRGIPAADLDAVCEAIVRIGEAAMALGDELEALEVNPLWVRGVSVEALDALAVWSAQRV